MEVKRLFDLLDRLKELYPKDDILCRKYSGKWIKYSTDDYYQKSHTLAYAFLALGFKPMTNVITVCNNRPEWNFIDMGLSLAHMIHIPVYTTLSTEDYSYIFKQSEAHVIIVGGDQGDKKIHPNLNKM
ncbi:MAG: AMP-binding protein, partial [Bacteroidales bacterium]|nr:AMP-binding protein [Bacteroidales bacterium]